MAEFVYMIDQRSVDRSQIKDRQLAESFEKLKVKLNGELSSLICPTHRRVTRVYLQSDGKKVRLGGFGPCCRSFGDELIAAAKLAGYDAPDGVWMTRENTFTLR